MSSNIAVEISANVGQLTAGLSLAQQNLKDTTSAVSALSKEMLNAGTTASDSLKGRFVEAAQALASARAEVTSMKSALAEASSAAHDGASANDNLKFATAGATREFIVLGHEAMSGNFSRIPGSLMVLAERMGGLHSVSLGLVAAVAAVGIGIYELGRYAYSAYEEVNKLQGTLLVLGRGQDFDAAKSRIDAMRGSLGTSRKDAMTVADAIEGIPIATDEARAAMERYAVLASAASRGNVDVGKTSEQIAAAAMTGAAGVERLGERWGLVFTPAQREALDQAKAANDVIQAQDVLVQALSARFEPAAAHVKGLVEQFTALAMASAGGAEGGMVQVPRVPKLETGPAVTIGDDQVASALKLSNALNPAARDAEDLRAKIGTLNAGLKALGDEADPAIRGKMAGAIDEAQRKLDTLQLGPVMARAKAEIASMQANWSGSEEGMLARSQAIWTSYLGQVRQGSAQYVEIQASADRTTTALHKLEATEHMRALEAATQAARAGSAERVAAAQAEVTFATSHYGAGSTQAIQAEKAMTAAKREESDARRNISIKEIDDQIKDLDRRLSADQKHNDQLVKQGKLSADDRAHAEIDTANTVYAMELELADRQIALLDKQTPAYQAAADRRKAIEQKLSDDLSRIDDQRATAQAAKNNTDAQAWSKSFQPVSSAFDTMTRGMLSGRQTLAQVMLSTASSFVTSELAADAKMLFSKLALYTAEKAGFITGESAKLLATKTTEGGMLTTLLFHSAAEKVQNATSVAGHATAEAAKTTATSANAGARTVLGATENSTWLGRLPGMIAQWLGLEASKTGATTAGAIERSTTDAISAAASLTAMVALGFAEIEVQASIAAAAAFADTASLGPEALPLAPGVAAAAYTATMGWAAGMGGGVALDVGAWEIPGTMQATLHKGETVVPATFASGLRQSGILGGGGAGAAGGDTHFHGPLVQLNGNTGLSPRDVAAALTQAVRNKYIARPQGA